MIRRTLFQVLKCVGIRRTVYCCKDSLVIIDRCSDKVINQYSTLRNNFVTLSNYYAIRVSYDSPLSNHFITLINKFATVISRCAIRLNYSSPVVNHCAIVSDILPHQITDYGVGFPTRIGDLSAHRGIFPLRQLSRLITPDTSTRGCLWRCPPELVRPV